MGKTPKPLTIICSESIAQWPEMLKLKEQGHVIATWQDVRIASVKPEEADIIFAENAHRMGEHERKWLPDAITEGRKHRYPPKLKPGAPAVTQEEPDEEVC